jgi:hypothetical protein
MIALRHSTRGRVIFPLVLFRRERWRVVVANPAFNTDPDRRGFAPADGAG